MFPNWKAPPGAAPGAGAAVGPPNWKTPGPPVDAAGPELPKLNPLLVVELPNGLEESAGAWLNNELVDELVDIPG